MRMPYSRQTTSTTSNELTTWISRFEADSLLGDLLLVSGLLLLLVLLVGGLGHVDVFESLELFDEECSHDSILDLGSVEDASVSSGDSSLGGGQLSELGRSGDLDSLHAVSLGVFSNVV